MKNSLIVGITGVVLCALTGIFGYAVLKKLDEISAEIGGDVEYIRNQIECVSSDASEINSGTDSMVTEVAYANQKLGDIVSSLKSIEKMVLDQKSEGFPDLGEED